jgi:hypothetical protein
VRGVEQILREAGERHGDRLVMLCSFQKEESVLLDALVRVAPRTRVVTIDTGVLFPETLQTWRAFEKRWGVRIGVEEAYGPWTGPEHCCSVEKVAALERALDGAEGVIVSDYGKGAITAGGLERLLVRAKARHVPVSVDPKETHFFSYTGAAVLTPNVHEAGRSFGRTIRDPDTLLAAGRELREKLDADAMLITRGAEGMSLFERGGRVTHLPTVAREVFDVTGAGDTVVATYALALACGAEPPLAAFLANHAAGLVIRHAGTAVTTADELVASLSAEPLAPATA